MTSDIAPLSDAPSDHQTLQLAYQRLLALERFKSGFLARTSHELRSPINTIVSLHQLILEDLCEGPEEEKEFIDQSKNAALKMLALFDRLTAVSKLDVGRESPHLENADLSFLLPEVEMLTTLQAANQNIRYTVELPTETLEIYTDPTWLKNILTSLIQDIIPQTKFLQLSVEHSVEHSEQQIAVVIECDRPAETLQAELDNVADISQLASTSASTSAPADTTDNSDNIKLSTGLILATAYTALPLIKGEFIITSPVNAEGSQLRCQFPATPATS